MTPPNQPRAQSQPRDKSQPRDQPQSKAQRRAQAQQRAAEKRAAELREKRVRTWTRVGLVGGVLALVIVLIVVLTGGGSSNDNMAPNVTHPHVTLQPIPASMSSTWVQPPSGSPGPETVPVPSGPKLATLINQATGQQVNGVQCQVGEKTQIHVHTHLTVFVNGKARVIPYGIGIPGAQAVSTAQGPFVETGSCFYWLHVHANDGIVHIESPNTTNTYNLGQVFAEWGQPLSTTQVGSAQGQVTVFFTSPGKKTGIYTGDPSNLPLGNHYQIQLDVGTPIVAPFKVTSWGGL